MKLCFVGDSHLTPVKLAWPETGGVRADFFPVRFDDDRGLVREGSRLVPASGRTRHRMFKMVGSDSFCPNEYDAIFVVGLNVGLTFPLSLLVSHRPFGWPIHRRQQLISKRALLDFVADSIAEARALRVVRSISEVRPKGVFILPSPNPSTILVESGKMGRAVDDGVTDMVRDIHTMYYNELTKHLPQPWSVLHQLERTMDEGIWTKPEYMQFPERNDAYHANESYGQVLVQQIMARLTA